MSSKQLPLLHFIQQVRVSVVHLIHTCSPSPSITISSLRLAGVLFVPKRQSQCERVEKYGYNPSIKSRDGESRDGATRDAHVRLRDKSAIQDGGGL
ncbi:hypothetical protein EVAR_7392_1 [Eumeta japonica]|uniref:Uncharacterized protein n=1 Tax=Eumeta variegata TaxID=151549 RepID=A0A4C1V6A9_EUMVA|nr:hypothetical protein EVAR_7392_1 [Eumeta japonica]